MGGGGMRQAGVIAAAGIVALEKMVDRLAEDHANARYMAERLADMPGILLDPERVRTNMILFDLEPGGDVDAETLVERVAQDGVLLQARSTYSLRAATHYGIQRADVDRALSAVQRALGN